jgi:hypothetical protein
MLDYLVGTEDPAALRGIAARLRQSIHDPSEIHRAMGVVADRLTTERVFTAPTGVTYKVAVPADRAERLRRIAAAYHAWVIAPTLAAAEELELLAADVRAEKLAG